MELQLELKRVEMEQRRKEIQAEAENRAWKYRMNGKNGSTS